MSVTYAKIEDCFDIIPSLTTQSGDAVLLEASLAQSLLDASRLIESELFAPVDYFAKSLVEASDKVIYSDGSGLTRLPPYTTLVSVKDKNGDVVDSDFYRLNSYDVYDPRTYFLKWLYRSCGGYNWYHYSPITVNANWGFPCIPPDIALAVKQMGCLMFLNNPQASVGLEDTLDANQEQRLRSTYTKVLNMWTDKFHHKNLGVG